MAAFAASDGLHGDGGGVYDGVVGVDWGTLTETTTGTGSDFLEIKLDVNIFKY